MLFGKQILHGIPPVALELPLREYLSPTWLKAPHRMVRLPNRKSAQTRFKFLCSLLWNHKREGWEGKWKTGSPVTCVTHLVTLGPPSLIPSHIQFGNAVLENPGIYPQGR